MVQAVEMSMARGGAIVLIVVVEVGVVVVVVVVVVVLVLQRFFVGMDDKGVDVEL